MNILQRTILALACSFVVSALLIRFVFLDQTPRLQAHDIRAYPSILARSINSMLSGTSTIIPSLLSMTERTPADQAVTPTWIPAPTGNGMGFETVPTIFIPTSVITAAQNQPTTPPVPSTAQPSPTTRPSPTPKPTSEPSPTPTPVAPPEYVRPGKNLEDIFNIAGEMTCMPPALLKAFVAQEGPGALTYNERSALFYNAYDWWHRVTELKQVCSGYGYYPETGLVAEDSMFAGEKCKEGINGDTVSKSLGATQILKYYWDKTFAEKTKQKLKVDKVDRRVLLDALVGFGIIIQEGVKHQGSCSDWDVNDVIKAACINTGGHCEYYNYCYTICKNYNKYANQNNNCDNASTMFVPDSYCVVK